MLNLTICFLNIKKITPKHFFSNFSGTIQKLRVKLSNKLSLKFIASCYGGDDDGDDVEVVACDEDVVVAAVGVDKAMTGENWIHFAD